MRRKLFAVATQQGGHFTAAQAREIGYSYQAQSHHVHAGNWFRTDRGLFRLAEWVPGIHDDLARWSLWAGGKAVVSHETALAVHGIGELESSRVHLTTPRPFSRSDPVVEVHVAELPREDIVDGPGFQLTSVVRSLVDVAAISADEDQLARAIQHARELGLVTARQLRRKADEVDVRSALHIERALNLADAS
jgi:predicted transcriptional regulator of viral defense system